jgi:hypothetical protein
MEEQARRETQQMELFLIVGLSIICMLCLVGGCLGSVYIIAC